MEEVDKELDARDEPDVARSADIQKAVIMMSKKDGIHLDVRDMG